MIMLRSFGSILSNSSIKEIFILIRLISIFNSFRNHFSFFILRGSTSSLSLYK